MLVACFRKRSSWFMEALNSFSKCHISYFFPCKLNEYNAIFLFVWQVTKEELASKEEIDHFRKHVTSLAALDFLVCLKSDVFVMTHGGNFAKLIIGARRYMGHRLKSIKPDKGLMSKSFGDPYMGWASFVEDVVITHHTRTGLPEETFPNYDIWENPLTPCMCRAWAGLVLFPTCYICSFLSSWLNSGLEHCRFRKIGYICDSVSSAGHVCSLCEK